MANVYTDKLKLRLPTQGDLNWDNEILDNAKAMEFIWAANLNLTGAQFFYRILTPVAMVIWYNVSHL